MFVDVRLISKIHRNDFSDPMAKTQEGMANTTGSTWRHMRRLGNLDREL
jgi:hypothetical protein